MTRAAPALAAVGVALIGLASAQEAAMEPELDLDAFADAVGEGLALEGVDAWEERVDAEVERGWLAGRTVEATEPDMVDMGDLPGGPATVGLSVRADDLVITRLVAPDEARARALVARLLDGFAAPLGAGPSGRPIARVPALVEARDRQVLLVRGAAVLDLARALGARGVAWEAGGLPAPASAAGGVALVDEGLLVLAWPGVVGPERDAVASRLRELEPTGSRTSMKTVRDPASGRALGYLSTAARAAEARRLVAGLATALRLDLELSPERGGEDR